MGWMWALIIRPLIADVFVFRKSLHRQQEGDRGGPNRRAQHVHEGNGTWRRVRAALG